MNVAKLNIGTEIKSYDYKPYGELEWSSTGTQERKGFATAEYDGESDYYSMGIRMYSAEIGRFLAVDPLFEAMPRHTPYHYGFNSPLVYCDPSGLAPEKEKNGEKLQNMIYDFMQAAWDAFQECLIENGRDARTTSSKGFLKYFGYNPCPWVNTETSIGDGDGGSRTSEEGSGENGIKYFEFKWCGKPVYVKYDSRKMTEKMI